MANKTLKILILVILVGLAVRVSHFASIHDTAFMGFPRHASELDMFGYWQWSDSIIDGDWLGRETWHPQYDWMQQLGSPDQWSRWWGNPGIFQQEPVYPYLLASGRVIGLSLSGLILVQLLIGALQPLATFFLTRQVFRQDGPALLSALFSALYGPLLFNQGVLLRDWLAPLLASVLLACLIRASRVGGVAWFLAGLTLGFMMMAHSTILIFVPALIIWLLWVNRHSPRLATMRMSAVFGGALTGFLPLMIRNIALGVSPFSISNRFPEGIVSGLAADANPLGMTITESLPGILEKAQGSATVAMIETLKSHRGDWAGFVSLIWQKLRGLIDPFEIPNNVSYAYGKEISPVLNYLPDFGWAFPIGVLGVLLVIRARRFDQANGLMILFGGSMLLALLLNLVLGRYRLAVSAFMFVYAGWALWQFWGWLFERRYSNLITAGAALTALVVVQQFLLPVRELRENAFFVFHPPSYFTAHKIYMLRGRPDLSISEWKRMQSRAERLGFETTADAAVEQEQSVRIQWLLRAFQLGQTEIVEMNLSEVDRLFDQRIDSSMRDYALGVANFRTGRLDEAIFRLQRFLREYPALTEAETAREIVESIEREQGSVTNP